MFLSKKVEIWDSGDHAEESWTSDKIVFSLNGKKLACRFCLVRFKKAGDRNGRLLAL
jgi:hypothetical protein